MSDLGMARQCSVLFKRTGRVPYLIAWECLNCKPLVSIFFHELRKRFIVCTAKQEKNTGTLLVRSQIRRKLRQSLQATNLVQFLKILTRSDLIWTQRWRQAPPSPLNFQS